MNNKCSQHPKNGGTCNRWPMKYSCCQLVCKLFDGDDIDLMDKAKHDGRANEENNQSRNSIRQGKHGAISSE